MSMLGEMTLEDAAQQAAGNWQRFSSFIWFRDREVEDADQWAIIYTHNRDSGLLDQSNAKVISKAMAPFTEGDDADVVIESHSHWAVGHVDGFSIRVFDGNGEITEAFRKYHELAEAMDAYPILDEIDYSERELEATSAKSIIGTIRAAIPAKRQCVKHSMRSTSIPKSEASMKKKMIPVRDFDVARFIESVVEFWHGQVPSMPDHTVAFPIVQNGFADFGTDCLEDDADTVGDTPLEWLQHGLTLFAQFTRRFDGTYDLADGTTWEEPEDYENDDVFLDEHSTYGFLIALKGEVLSIRTAILRDVTGECVVRAVKTTGPFEEPMVRFIESMKRKS